MSARRKPSERREPFRGSCPGAGSAANDRPTVAVLRDLEPEPKRGTTLPNRTRFLGKTLAVAGIVAALALATAMPAAADTPSTVEQDVAQLYQDVVDLYNGLPADALRGVDRLIESPVSGVGPRSNAARGPVPGGAGGARRAGAGGRAAQRT